MAKIKPVSGKRTKKSKELKRQETLRALPCLLIVVLGMVLVFWMFYLGLKGT